ncbi:MAG: extracellular solute-binding protein [Thermomicrobia bacterium]|nr:extracellular solute-binding protein [Thermomicrobia bacterium]
MFNKHLTAVTSRRAFLRGAAATAATAAVGTVLAACGGSSATATTKPAATVASTAAPAASTSAPAASAAAPTTGTSAAADWGKANNVSVEYVPLDGSTYDAKVAGAIETGAIPDVIMLSGTNTIYYAAQNRLADLTDVYNDVKALGGGIYEQLLPYVTSNGKVYSIPMQADLSVMYARLDLIEKATGNRTPPDTWDAVEAIARKVNSPPTLYGIGFTLGRTPDGDGNIQQLLFADGGTLVDKDGKPAINNDGTVNALTRVQKWWKDKLIPQDSPGWDDTGNNKSYQSRQSAFVFNPASIFAYLDQNDKDLLKDTTQAVNPKGKAGLTGSSLGTWSWSVFSASKQVDASKAMIRAIMQPDTIEAVYEKVGGRWYPVYKDLATAKFWKDRPYFDAFPQGIASAKPAWLPAQATPDLLTQMSAAGQKRIYSEMLQDVVVSNKSPQDAAKAAQTKMEQAFAEAIKK